MTTYNLTSPVQLGATAVTRLVFREHSTAADYLAFDQRGGVAQNIALIASLSDSDRSLIERLHGRDYLACLKIANGILERDNELIAGDAGKGEGAMSAEKK